MLADEIRCPSPKRVKSVGDDFWREFMIVGLKPFGRRCRLQESLNILFVSSSSKTEQSDYEAEAARFVFPSNWSIFADKHANLFFHQIEATAAGEDSFNSIQ